ncbi:MAG: ArsR/SmtB family transcription factor [Cytophagaceae bacterium]
MAVSKKDEFQAHQVKLSVLAKALSHPARVAIVELLATRGPSLCGTIVNELPLSQSTISQHLKELRSAGLIKGEIDGPRVNYFLDDEQFKLSKIFLDRFFNETIRLAEQKKMAVEA